MISWLSTHPSFAVNVMLWLSCRDESLIVVPLEKKLACPM